MHTHTKDILADELRKAGLPEMADKAAQGYYHDFLSPLAAPELQLLQDLQAAGTPAALALAERHMKGEFDASKQETYDWAKSPDGQATFGRLVTDTVKGRTQIGRLALRHEGNMWNAYYAMIGTMDGAVPLGSIAIAVIEMNETRKRAFMDMMRDILADILEDKTGVRPTWGGPQGAPEHERAGHS
jgi:hypothetical protein